MKLRSLALAGLLTVATACSTVDQAVDAPEPSRTTHTPSASSVVATEPEADSSERVPLMPDLLGMPSAKAGERLGELGLGSTWGPPVAVRCEARPGTIARQKPAAGTPLEPDTTVTVRTAALDLDQFRGPCEPDVMHLGDGGHPDVALASEFYRFAADPALGAPFGEGTLWVGIEDGVKATRLAGNELSELASWELHGVEYAERSDPFSALDMLAASGGRFELHDGVVGTCPGGNDKAPSELAGLRAISLTAPEDVTSACHEWWGVTLFLDSDDEITGVALRLGSP